MSNTSIQELLSIVQLPSRYLGNEIYRVKKNWDKTELHFALAFPDLYEIATSHFGIQILYGMLNGQEDILAERVFAPAQDMENHLRKGGFKLCSLESQIPLHRFDIIGFSLLYELNYTNMLNMIDLAGLSFYSNQRKETDPILIAGGPCMCNPEPVADFFDAILVGDGEPAILKMTDEWKVWRKSKERTKKNLLVRWSKIKGVYIPSFFSKSSTSEKNEKLIPKFSFYKSVQRSVASDLNDAFFPTTPVIPFGKPIHDRLRMEIARGCTRGCRFCQAGMIYRPVRERDPISVVDSVHSSLEKTGYEDLSLLSLSTGDYSCIAPLMKKIMEFGQKDHVAVSLPSLRAGSLTPELMELVKKVRKTGFTIAPEAGSQRLRNVINKNISEEDIEKTVENAFFLGWKLIKLYFMVGLPTETQNDLQAIVSLVHKLQKTAKRFGKAGKMNVSVATFVPKPQTPFQWEPQISLESAMEKISWLKAQLKSPAIHVKWQDPKVSMIEGVWSRGDRKLGSVLIKAWEKGCRFDGWSDHFDYKKWEDVFTQSGINRNDYSKGIEDTEKTLPWDHIHMGVDRDFLIKEKEKALSGEITDDCRTGTCSGCGVCDFSALQPVSYHNRKINFSNQSSFTISENEDSSITYGINFSKMGDARFLGHLEMVKLFVRALRREKIPLRYSRGFHPMPKIFFLDTLPMGMQSEDETMLIKVSKKIKPHRLVDRMQSQLPSGFTIMDCFSVEKKEMINREAKRIYTVQLNHGVFDEKKLDWFRCEPSVPIEKKSKKNKRVVLNLKNVVSDITKLDSSTVRITLEKENNLTIRPSQAIKRIFDLTEYQILTAVITKRKSDYV
jgi:radical SAM family uncharacterized protein/radical SAM-linked protein